MTLEDKNSGFNWIRPFLIGLSLALVGVVWIQPLAHLLRSGATPAGAAGISIVSILLAFAMAFLKSIQSPIRGAAGGLLAGAAVLLLEPQSGTSVISLVLLGAFLGWVTPFLSDRLPHNLGASLIERRFIAALWIFLAAVSLLQMGRLATWTTDPESDFVLTTRNPFWYRHLCLPAYLYGGELALRGEENLYAAEHYPGTNPEASPETEVTGMSVEDPYQYPPQFLLLPAAALQLSNDFNTLRIFWFALQVTLFAGTFLALAWWIGGISGALAAWSFPLLFAAFPILLNFQFGQFHLFAVVMAIAGMLAFQYRYRAAGSFLLAWAVLAKIFPLLLVPVLVVNRKFKELAWLAGWGLALTLLTLVVLGPAPFEAFFEYHLPRLESGAAFAFDEVWPELSDLVVADNQGIFGLARKFGVSKPIASEMGRWFGWLLFVVAAVAGFRFRGRSRWHSAVFWLSLLGLGSMASPGAWGDYVPSVAVWLLALMVGMAAEDHRWAIPFGAVALFQGLLLGTMPIGDWAPPALMIPVSAVGVFLLLGLYGGTLLLAPRRTRAEGEVAADDSAEALRKAA